MGHRTLRRFFSGLLVGLGCGATTFAIAAVSGYSLAQVHLTRVVATQRPPTVEETQRALEQRTGEPYPMVTPEPSAASAALRSSTPMPLEQPQNGEAPPGTTSQVPIDGTVTLPRSTH